MQKLIIFFLIVFLLLPLIIFARIGVGIGSGTIKAEPMKPGGIYSIPPVVIINTGTEPSDYGMDIQYHHQSEKPEFWPPKEWFQFDPATFYLEPGEVQKVNIKLVLPLKGAEPGDYFSYLQAKPIIKSEDGTGTSAKMNVAAAAKLYFTIKPANIFQAVIHRIKTFFEIYSPWSWVFLWIIVGAVIIALFAVIFKKFFKLNIGIQTKNKKKPETKPAVKSKRVRTVKKTKQEPQERIK